MYHMHEADKFNEFLWLIHNMKLVGVYSVEQIEEE